MTSTMEIVATSSSYSLMLNETSMDIVKMYDQLLSDHPPESIFSFYKTYIESVSILECKEALEHYLKTKKKSISEIKEKLSEIAVDHLSDRGIDKIEAAIEHFVSIEDQHNQLFPSLLQLAQNIRENEFLRKELAEKISTEEALNRELHQKITHFAKYALGGATVLCATYVLGPKVCEVINYASPSFPYLIPLIARILGIPYYVIARYKQT